MFRKILVNNAIAGSEEGQDMSNKMPFSVLHADPIFLILAQVYFFRGPETCFCLFIVFPDLMLTDREEHKTVFVFFENRLLMHCLAHSLLGFKVKTKYQRVSVYLTPPYFPSKILVAFVETDGYPSMSASSVQMK